MKAKILLGITFLFVLAACASNATATLTPTPAITATPYPTHVLIDGMVTKVVSDGKVTFTDMNAGFALEYPEGWLIDLTAGGSRGVFVYLITSLDFIPGMRSAIPKDATLVFVTVAGWDEPNDLPAFVEFQKQGWEKSGDVIVSEEERAAPSGDPIKYVVTDSRDGHRYHIYLKTLGNRYTVISGYGDLEAIWAIALSVR
jgi:hypothetical protein